MSAVQDRDRGYRDLMQRLAGAHSVQVLVGVRSDGGQVLVMDDSGIVDAQADVAEYAAYNEFGTQHTPERSFLRSTIDENRAKYIRMLTAAVDDMIDGVPPLVAYGRIGLVAVADVQRKIRSNVPPPNAPSTVARKGSNKTLIDTGRLRQSIDYTIRGLPGGTP